jgi:hypothetical protein
MMRFEGGKEMVAASEAGAIKEIWRFFVGTQTNFLRKNRVPPW